MRCSNPLSWGTEAGRTRHLPAAGAQFGKCLMGILRERFRGRRLGEGKRAFGVASFHKMECRLIDGITTNIIIYIYIYIKANGEEGCGSTQLFFF